MAEPDKYHVDARESRCFGATRLNQKGGCLGQDGVRARVVADLPARTRELAHLEEGFYIVGSKSYGRAPTFLLLTGYEQARSVVAMIAGDVEAAERVELELPETGVCRVDVAEESKSSGGCCGPKPKACC